MTDRLWLGQFTIAEGQAVEQGPNSGIFRGRSGDDRSVLYVVAESVPLEPGELAGHLVSSIGHTFSSLDLSISGVINRSLRAAQQNLLEWNRRAEGDEKTGLGLSLVVARSDAIVFGQVGPSLAYALSGGNFYRLEPEGDAAVPLGFEE